MLTSNSDPVGTPWVLGCLEAAYAVGNNPLPLMRDVFPLYEWNWAAVGVGTGTVPGELMAKVGGWTIVLLTEDYIVQIRPKSREALAARWLDAVSIVRLLSRNGDTPSGAAVTELHRAFKAASLAGLMPDNIDPWEAADRTDMQRCPELHFTSPGGG